MTYTPDRASRAPTRSPTPSVRRRGGTATATVTVTVHNAAPSAGADSRTTDRGIPVTIDVLTNDTDPNGRPACPITCFSAISAAGGAVDRDHGGTADPADDGLVYTPPAGFAGADTFTYTVADGHGRPRHHHRHRRRGQPGAGAMADSATVPTRRAGHRHRAENDTDPDGDALTVTAPDSRRRGDRVVDADGTVTYTPAPGFAGTDTFTYTVSDGHGGTAPPP